MKRHYLSQLGRRIAKRALRRQNGAYSKSRKGAYALMTGHDKEAQQWLEAFDDPEHIGTRRGLGCTCLIVNDLEKAEYAFQ